MFFSDYPLTCAFICYTLACFLGTRLFQRTKIELTYNKEDKNSPIAKIVAASNLKDSYDYVPYTFAWFVHF